MSVFAQTNSVCLCERKMKACRLFIFHREKKMFVLAKRSKGLSSLKRKKKNLQVITGPKSLQLLGFGNFATVAYFIKPDCQLYFVGNIKPN